jgi:hypothetical protein
VAVIALTIYQVEHDAKVAAAAKEVEEGMITSRQRAEKSGEVYKAAQLYTSANNRIVQHIEAQILTVSSNYFRSTAFRLPSGNSGMTRD